VLVCGVNGALTRADENEVGEQQLTPCAPLNCLVLSATLIFVLRDGGQAFVRR
jgi:hypothetical protein